MAAGHEHSVLYGPVNAAWDALVSATGTSDRFADVQVPDHVVMSLFVMAVCAVVFIPMRRLFSLERPGKFQQMLELLVQGLRDLLEDMIGHGAGHRFLPIIGTFAVFIFFSNMSGQFFFLQPPTSNPNTTFALALTAVGYYHLQGLKRHGLGYFKQFLGPVPGLFLLFIPLEIISHVARAISLGLRLFGNIFGEHLAAGVFFALVPFVVPFPLMALGIFGSLLQTFIFVMLTTVYIAGAEASEH